MAGAGFPGMEFSGKAQVGARSGRRASRERALQKLGEVVLALKGVGTSGVSARTWYCWGSQSRRFSSPR